LTIGSPFGQNTVTSGIVGVARAANETIAVHQTDVAVSPQFRRSVVHMNGE
jgi:S1-C subfamily serine protease